MDWSIDELAALVGVPTRTLREYRTLGLIDPPRKVGRVGRYGQPHRRRLELIARLQERGYSLAAIKDLCTAAASGRSLDDVLDGSGSVTIDDGAVAYSLDEVTALLPALADGAVRSAAIDAELVAKVGERWLVRAPSLLALVADLITFGASPEAAIRMAAGFTDGARVQAAAFAACFVDELWTEGQSGDALAATVSRGRRVRLQLSQAVASLVVHHIGLELRARADQPGGRDLNQLVDELRVGVVRSAGGRGPAWEQGHAG